MEALPMPRPYAAALGWLRREMGEVDLAAVEAMKDLPTEILRSWFGLGLALVLG